MCYFVAEDGSESVVVSSDGKDAGVDEDFAAGDHEGVAFCIAVSKT